MNRRWQSTVFLVRRHTSPRNKLLINRVVGALEEPAHHPEGDLTGDHGCI
jgi:hypothetical protein